MEINEFDSLNKVINSVQFKILEHGHLLTGREWNFPGICSPFNRLYLVTGGSGQIKDKDNIINLQKGYMYLVPLYHTCDYSCNDVLEKFYIHFRLELIPGHDLFEGYGQCGCNLIEADLVEGLLEKAKNGQISDYIYCKSVLLGCISKFLDLQNTRIKEQISISWKHWDIYEYIENHCYADLRVKNIAEFLKVPPGNISKNFKNSTGITLKRFIDNKVVQKAQEKLLVTDMSVKAIAVHMGFSDEFHFSSFFKKHVGLSPNKYRQHNNLYK